MNNMRPKTSKSRKIITSVVLLAALSMGILYYMYHFQVGLFEPPVQQEPKNNPTTINYGKPTSDEVKVGNDIKAQSADAAKNDQSSTGTSGTTQSTLAMDITSTVQNGSTYYVRASIETLTTTGTCILTMNGPNGATYSAEAGVQAMASNTTCKGFNVPMGSLTSGKWSITIKFNDGDKNASATKEVTI